MKCWIHYLYLYYNDASNLHSYIFRNVPSSITDKKNQVNVYFIFPVKKKISTLRT